MRQNTDQRQRHRHRAMIVIGSIFLLFAVVAVFAGIGYIKYLQIQAAAAAPPPPEMPISMTLATAETISFRRSTVVVGTVLAPQSIRLRTELNGMVTNVPMVPGKIVTAGELLVQFDDRTEQAELKSADANRKLGMANLTRAKRLASANASSDQELDIAAAEVTRSDAEVERLQVLIDKKSLRAPFDAKVGLFDLHVGQYLEQGTEIATLEGIADYLNIDFSVPAHVADAIEIGNKISVRINLQSPELIAEISALDASADSVSRSVTARARLNNPPQQLQPNDSVRVTVEYGEPVAAISIPSTAVRRGPTGTSVFVAIESEKQSRAQARNIVLAGGGDGEHSWVASGIVAGEQVVADGSFKVHEGALLAGPAIAAEESKGEVTANSAATLHQDASSKSTEDQVQ